MGNLAAAELFAVPSAGEPFPVLNLYGLVVCVDDIWLGRLMKQHLNRGLDPRRRRTSRVSCY